MSNPRSVHLSKPVRAYYVSTCPVAFVGGALDVGFGDAVTTEDAPSVAGTAVPEKRKGDQGTATTMT